MTGGVAIAQAWALWERMEQACARRGPRQDAELAQAVTELSL